MQVNEIRNKIEKSIQKSMKSEKLTFTIKSGAYGHSAGDAVENLIKNILKNDGWDVYFTEEFIEKVFNKIGNDKNKINSFLDKMWWSDLPIYSKNQLNNYLKGKHIGGYQQAGADIVLFYGDDLRDEYEKIILINAKSHNIDRNSRAPNIISAQRLLEFCNKLLSSENKLKYAEYWFVGVNHISIGKNTAEIKSILIKDLFKINTNKITQINFDAAIQIQTHIKDMEEINQTKEEFIRKLSNLFIETWYKHSNQKTKKYEKLVNDINSHFNV